MNSNNNSSPWLGLPLLTPEQSQPEILINEAIIRLEALMMGVIKESPLPPAEPALGELYLVSSKAMGVWQEFSGWLAHYYHGWRFIEPKEGFRIWRQDKKQWWKYEGKKWQTT